MFTGAGAAHEMATEANTITVSLSHFYLKGKVLGDFIYIYVDAKRILKMCNLMNEKYNRAVVVSATDRFLNMNHS